MPLVDGRYWLGITLASVFGTNLGDFYAHESGLGTGFGLLVLVALVATVFAAERLDRRTSELYYWLVIIIIRTGATNIADYLAYRVRIPSVPLSVGLLVVLAALAWRAKPADRTPAGRLPDTGAAYWSAMLTAGVFGTVFGDVCSHLVGQGVASIALGLILGLVLLAARTRAAGTLFLYWGTVAVARTAGTAIGDWLAENTVLHLGLPLSTLITGCTFVALLLMWRSRRVDEALTINGISSEIASGTDGLRYPGTTGNKTA
jgi:uncharacterized membrane-anchored protein